MAVELPRIELSVREALPSEIARKLLDHLLSGQLQPGTRMPSERKLAEALGVGRSAVREALKSLGLLGLVEVRQGDGTYLRRPDSDILPRVIEWGLLLGERRVQDLVEARQHIEVVVAQLAAERRNKQDVVDLRERLERMREARDAADFVDADVAFHLRVAEAAGNSVLSNMLSSIQSLLHVWVRRVIQAAGETETSYAEHVPVFEAIERGDPAAAAAAMRAHMKGAAGRLHAAIEAATAEGTTAVAQAK